MRCFQGSDLELSVGLQKEWMGQVCARIGRRTEEGAVQVPTELEAKVLMQLVYYGQKSKLRRVPKLVEGLQPDIQACVKRRVAEIEGQRMALCAELKRVPISPDVVYYMTSFLFSVD